MYISNVSIKNFGPYSIADFDFSGQEINVVVGAIATGKTQLCGAIIAAIVGRSAVEIRDGGVGPSVVSVTLFDGASTEVSALRISNDLGAKVIVSHMPSPLAIGILATMSDSNSPRLMLTQQSGAPCLTKADLEVMEHHLPDSVKCNEQWAKFRQNHGLNRQIGSAGEAALACLVREFVVREKLESRLPLIVDEFAVKFDEVTRILAVEVLREVSKLSQVIIFSNRKDLFINGAIIELARPLGNVSSLTGYNNLLFDQKSIGRARKPASKWIRGAKFPHEENRTCELKEVKGGNPVNSIKSLVDQYAVAFMNAGISQAGSIFWGVRDEDMSIIGVSLTRRECDEIRRVVTEKLHQIVPVIAPTSYQVELHLVSDGIKTIEGLYIVEVRIPAVRRTLLFATGSQEVYVKTDAGKRRLSAVEIQHELLRRVGIDPTF